jgi:hypothetical protein
MHEWAVFCLCALMGFYLWCDAALLLIAWYSGVDPPIATSTKVWVSVRWAIGVAAIVTALATL